VSLNSFDVARQNMINSQLRPNRLTDDRVADAIEKVSREIFVPEDKRGVAYMDEDIHLGNGRYIMEPITFAKLVQVAQLSENDVVLDVACTTGYSTAVLSYLANTIVGVEENDELASQAQDNLTQSEIANADVLVASHAGGYPDQSPYSVIFIQGAVSEVPKSLLNQLGEGGRLLAVVRNGQVGQAHIYRSLRGRIADQVLFDASVPVLPGFEPADNFEF
jgi:protein-L-isoaspartate(D-aspartate) O-methyltransferase